MEEIKKPRPRSVKKTTAEFKEEVKERVGDEYSVLSRYEGSKDKIKMRHNLCQHEYEVKPNLFLNGRRCPECAKAKKGKATLVTESKFLEKLKEARGNDISLLSGYVDMTRTKAKFKCNICNYVWSTIPYYITSGRSICPCCTQKIRLNKESYIELVHEYDPEYEILSDFVNRKTSVKMYHKKCGYKFDILPYYFLRSECRCYKCNPKEAYNKKSDDQFRLQASILFENFFDDYEILDEYVDKNTKLRFKHKTCGLIYEKSPDKFLNQKQLCPSCVGGGVVIPEKLTIEDVNERLNENSVDGSKFEVVSEYISNKKPLTVKHINCGYEFDIVLNNTNQSGLYCKKCNPKFSSKPEMELYDFLSNIIGEDDIITHNREILNGTELDFYIPSKNLAIEFDGLYWHSEANGKNKSYHINKTNACSVKGIQLIHIFSDEWYSNKDLIKFKLIHLLGENKNPRIYARKCYIEEIDSNLKKEFLNNNHIQGNDRSILNLGLWYPHINDNGEEIHELVSVLTISELRISLGNKNRKEGVYELSRFASDLNYKVVGGFSKLFSYLKNNYDFDKIITYADKRWSSGNLYIKNGFTHTHDSSPSYWYTNGTIRKHRYTFRKNNLQKLFPDIYRDELSESQIMELTNYSRIWDCGNMVFEFINNNGK